MVREVTRKTIEEYIVELRKRAERSQEEAQQTFNPLYGDDERPPRDFVESSYLFIRSCDADVGSRPLPCPVFWLSPDLRVAPLSNVGAATTELQAGDAYRLTATVRNRGDLMVPSAKVEFYLVNPTLGFDTRFATKLGVVTGRVQAHGASEISLDYVVPPALSGHRCLFARVFAFSPLDVPIDDYALDPRIDRHIGQLNLNIVGQATSLTLDWIHLGNALERLVIAPMEAPALRELRLETVSALALVDAGLWREAGSRVTFETKIAEGAAVQIDEREGGLSLSSIVKDAVPLEEQVELTNRVQAALRALELGRGSATEYRELFRQYRAMTQQSFRTQVTIGLPDLGLEPGQGVALNVVRQDGDGKALGGIGLVITGPPRPYD